MFEDPRLPGWALALLPSPLLGQGRLLRWDLQHETGEGRLVRPGEFLRTLSWGSVPSAAIILAEGLRAEAGRRQG